MTTEVISEMRGSALIITFNRPDHGNALSFDLAQQLFGILKNVTTDRSVRAVLLRGNGASFMDGLELAPYFANIDAALDRANHLMLPYHSVVRELQAMEKPVLAAVHGKVSGPGMSLMLASDLVLAARNTQFNCNFTPLAKTPDGGASFFLTRKVGMAKANELLMLSDTFSAADAEKWHLINAVIDDDKLRDEALNWADRLSQGPTRAFGGIKMLVSKAFEQNLNAHLGLEHTYWGNTSRSFDFREAVRALATKRPPKFTGA